MIGIDKKYSLSAIKNTSTFYWRKKHLLRSSSFGAILLYHHNFGFINGTILNFVMNHYFDQSGSTQCSHSRNLFILWSSQKLYNSNMYSNHSIRNLRYFRYSEQSRTHLFHQPSKKSACSFGRWPNYTSPCCQKFLLTLLEFPTKLNWFDTISF